MIKGNINIFDKIFSSLNTEEIFQINNCINVKNSKNITISHNKFNTNIIFDSMARSDLKEDTQSIRIDFDECVLYDKMERALLNVKYMDNFIFECNRKNICPVFRYYGLFSHLSSLRCSSDYSDYNQLILKEKSLFEEMLKLNYKIKLIISLDIPIIVTKWGYTLVETKDRIANLCDNVDFLTKNHNIKIVIDEKNSMDGMFILDKSILIKATSINPEKKYNITQYETNKYVIDNTITEFDAKFAYLEFQNNSIRKMFRIDSYSSLIRKIVESRMEYYYSLLEGGHINEFK